MEMGVPGLKPAQVGIDAEIKALKDGVASIYPNINGIPEVKKEASRFIKAFINIDIDPECCVPVTGSMQGTYASFLTSGQCTSGKDTILFIDPGFPVQKQQIVVMGYKYASFDVYEYRGEKLRDILEEYLSKGNIAAMIYASELPGIFDSHHFTDILDNAYDGMVALLIAANTAYFIVANIMTNLAVLHILAQINQGRSKTLH